MTATEVLRKQIKQSIDKADDRSLRRIQAILEVDQEEEEWWDDLPREIQASLERALKESEEGKGISHEQMLAKYSQWFKK
jgi:hypothetical protein